MKAYYDSKPSQKEAVGNGSFLYRWNISEETVTTGTGDEEETVTRWVCDETTVWPPLTSGKVIEAVIGESYTQAEEVALVNKYNSYQQGLPVSGDVVTEYTDYLAFVADTKRMVKGWFGESTVVSPDGSSMPKVSDLAKLLSLTVNSMSVSDADALQLKSVYPQWKSLMGKAVKKGQKMQYGGKLWKVVQDHTVAAEHAPGKGTESLYTEIVESGKGTKDDPIPYDNNMELSEGKYYSQDGVVYKCTRDTGQPVYNPLSALVGLYVEAV